MCGASPISARPTYTSFSRKHELYWARSRTRGDIWREGFAAPSPEVKTELGPDATGVGWVYQYALSDTTGQHNLADLRSVQDWYIRPHLEAVSSVAEVAGLGGFVREYQVNLDPLRLQPAHLTREGDRRGARRQQRRRRPP